MCVVYIKASFKLGRADAETCKMLILAQWPELFKTTVTSVNDVECLGCLLMSEVDENGGADWGMCAWKQRCHCLWLGNAKAFWYHLSSWQFAAKLMAYLTAKQTATTLVWCRPTGTTAERSTFAFKGPCRTYHIMSLLKEV